MSHGHLELTAEMVRRLTIDTEPWLSCDDCFHLADQYVELALGPAAAGMPQMRAHLAGCPACSEEATSLLLLLAEDAGIDPGPALRRLHGD